MDLHEPFVGNIAGEFSSFLQSQNLAGLVVGFLIGSSTLDVAKSMVNTIIMPLVVSLQTMQMPDIDFLGLYEPLLVFLLTLFVCFAIIKLGHVAPKPIQLVQVVNQ